MSTQKITDDMTYEQKERIRAKRREWQRNYRKKNKEKEKEYRQRYYEKHPEKKAEKQRKNAARRRAIGLVGEADYAAAGYKAVFDAPRAVAGDAARIARAHDAGALEDDVADDALRRLRQYEWVIFKFSALLAP